MELASVEWPWQRAAAIALQADRSSNSGTSREEVKPSAMPRSSQGSG